MITRKPPSRELRLVFPTLLSLACLLGGIATGRAAREKPAPVLALVNGTLIDGTGAAPIPDGAVLIQEGTILAAGKRSTLTIPAGATIIDAGGGTILPGFIDAHVHNAVAQNLALWARAGVTTVRDLGAADAALIFATRKTAQSARQWARLVAAGPIITAAPDGYPISGNGFPAVTVTSPDDARRKTDEVLDQGANVIKIALEVGPGWPMLSAEEVEAIVRTAHARGVPVSAHVTLSSYCRLAVTAGIDDIAHSLADRMPDDLLARIIRDDVYLIPTLVAQDCEGSSLENLARFIAAGGKVALGDDAGYLGGPVMPIREMELMQKAGMTPLQIIVAGTRNAAHVCRREGDLGTLTAGKLADVLVVGGDPLRDIHALADVRLVLREGVTVLSKL